MELDDNGYPIGDIKHSKLIHRQIAFNEIYVLNRQKYPLLFEEYIVHHINGDKENFALRNLYLCEQETHKIIHSEQKRLRRKFLNASQIDRHLINYDKKLIEAEIDRDKIEEKKKEEIKRLKEIKKKSNCLDCGREIKHKGRCITCNIQRKAEREREEEKQIPKKHIKKKSKFELFIYDLLVFSVWVVVLLLLFPKLDLFMIILISFFVAWVIRIIRKEGKIDNN
jgi:hypothetical protein